MSWVRVPPERQLIFLWKKELSQVLYIVALLSHVHYTCVNVHVLVHVLYIHVCVNGDRFALLSVVFTLPFYVSANDCSGQGVSDLQDTTTAADVPCNQSTHGHEGEVSMVTESGSDGVGVASIGPSPPTGVCVCVCVRLCVCECACAIHVCVVSLLLSCDCHMQ